MSYKANREPCIRQIRLYYGVESYDVTGDVPFAEDHMRQDAIAMNLQRQSSYHPSDSVKSDSPMKQLVFSVFLFSSICHAANGLTLSDLLDRPPAVERSMPSARDVIGVEVGERHLYHDEIIQYLDELAARSPRMVALGEHAKSYGGRPLVSYAISSPRNIERLDQIRNARASLIDPSADPDLSRHVAVMHMMYSIHGNEPSGSNSTPLVAYYLTASRDKALAAQLDKVVIIFNPMLNPDGLDRFAHWTNSHRGNIPSKDPNDREHEEAFPGGRTNYYWFDLNRDWLPHQHPESRGRLRLFHEWKPNVQLDFHEQGSDNSYFFMPGKPERTNPLTPAINQELTNKIAEFHRRVFDEDGTLYFSEESYDDFYVGKGSTYPDLFGAVGILFEQPSSRGARQKTQNGLLTFQTSIANQFKASLSSIKATAALKDELLAYQRNFYIDNAGRNGSRRGAYLAATNGDPTRLAEFVRLLRGHRIEVELVTADIEVDGRLYPAGQAIAVPANQTQSAFLRSLWNRQVEFEENVFYDVSTWTLPWAFNLTHTREPVRNVDSRPLPADFKWSQGRDLQHSAVGYLIDWRDSASPALLYALLAAEANVRVATRPLTARIEGGGEMEFGYGTLLVSSALNESIPDKAIKLLQEAAAAGLPVYPAASSGTPSGIDLGSRDFEVIELPEVLVATGPGASAYRVGEIWHLLDRRVEMPVTMVDTDRLTSIDLGEYTHLFLTNPVKIPGESGIEKLRRFVEDGGILWAQGDSTVEWLDDNELTDVIWRKTAEEKARQAEKMKDNDPNGGKGDDDGHRQKDDRAAKELPARKPFVSADKEAAFKLVSGTILEGSLDITHPMGYGYTSDFLPVFRRGGKFMERSRNPYSTPVLYASKPLLSGYISDENKRLAANSAGIVVDQAGEGAIVLALDRHLFRAFWWGTQRLVVNAIFYGDLLEEPE